jgi:very-short-patch-repair endonuclease
MPATAAVPFSRPSARRLRPPVESPFELDVLAVCESLGWRVDCQVGCSGYRIDLAARDPEAPGRHVLAIECDGATYHSGATARDRDRLRRTVLEGLGWRFHRIWSTDWRLNRETEVERLKKAYRDACEAPRRPPSLGANRELRSEAKATQEAFRSAPAPVATVAVKTTATVADPVDPKSVTDTMRKDAILAVLKEGGTMPRDALIKAAATRVGHLRVGTRIKDAFGKVVDQLLAERRLALINERITLK